jgi:hypothetical protein
MAGEWVGDEKIHPSPWDPNGGSAIGRVHNRLALEGFAVIQDYEQERDGRVNFAGHGIFRWDPLEQCYILYWFDSMGMPPNIFKGTFDARVLKLVSKNGQGHSRAVFDFSKENQYDYRMEVSPDGTQWYLFMNGIYRRSV